MKTVSGKVVSSKPISLSRAATTISCFVSTDNAAPQALCAYLRRASAAFNELKQLHKELKSGRTERKNRKSKSGTIDDRDGVEENPTRSEVSLEFNRPVEATEKVRTENRSEIENNGNVIAGERNKNKKKKKKRRDEVVDDAVAMKKDTDFATGVDGGKAEASLARSEGKNSNKENEVEDNVAMQSERKKDRKKQKNKDELGQKMEIEEEMGSNKKGNSIEESEENNKDLNEEGGGKKRKKEVEDGLVDDQRSKKRRK